MAHKPKIHPDDVKSPIDSMSVNDMRREEVRFKENIETYLETQDQALKLIDEGR